MKRNTPTLPEGWVNRSAGTYNLNPTWYAVVDCKPRRASPFAYLILAALLLAFAFSAVGCDCAPQQQAGRRAYEAGIPATANPYQGERGMTMESRAWLEGYIAAKKEAEAKR